MEYYIFSYAIDVNKIKQVFNSKDRELYSEMIKTHDFDFYSYGVLDDDLEVEKALEDIIEGRPFDEEYPHIYAYAFMSICKHLGGEHPHRIEKKRKYETDLMMDVMLTDFGVNFVIKQELFTCLADLNLPVVKNWPIYGIVDANNVPAVFDMVKDIKIEQEEIDKLRNSDDIDDKDKAVAYENIRGLMENLQYSIDHNFGIVSFSI